MTEERRNSLREGSADRDVRCRTERCDGKWLEGLVVDISEGGAKIHGSASGLGVGESVRLVLHFLTGEKVAYRAVVRHVGVDEGSFGVKFSSEPERFEVQGG